MTLWPPSNCCSCHRAKPYLHISALGCKSFPLQHHRFNLLSYKSGVSWSNNVSAETQCFINPNCDTSITNIDTAAIDLHNTFSFASFESVFIHSTRLMPSRCLPVLAATFPSHGSGSQQPAKHVYEHTARHSMPTCMGIWINRMHSEMCYRYLSLPPLSCLPRCLCVNRQNHKKPEGVSLHQTNRFFNQLLKPAPLRPFTTLNIMGFQYYNTK